MKRAATAAQLFAGWSSPVARQAHNLKVAGSNPAPATNYKQPGLVPGFFCARLRSRPVEGAGEGLPARGDRLHRERREAQHDAVIGHALG